MNREWGDVKYHHARLHLPDLSKYKSLNPDYVKQMLIDEDLEFFTLTFTVDMHRISPHNIEMITEMVWLLRDRFDLQHQISIER